MATKAPSPPATLARSASSGGVAPQNHMGSPIFDEQRFSVPAMPVPRKESLTTKSVRQDPEPRNAPLLTWILGFLCLILVVALIALGIGLGIKWNQAEDTIAALRLASSQAQFNYSNYYGIPQNLPVVEEKNLFRQNELDLNTGFVVSNQTTTRIYTLNITQALASPDGFQKPMILINNQFPGPLIEANSGDLIRIIVNNNMANWSTSINWHGLDMRNANWYDGVAGVTQCGIPPGKSFAYEIPTDGQRGTFWYRSQLSMQATDGLFGPIVIHDPYEHVPPVDGEKLILMGDWYHTYSSVLATSYLNPTSLWSNVSGVEPLPDNLLMNGHNTYNCSVKSSVFPPNMTAPVCSSGSLYNTKVESNKTYRLRLINHSTFLSYWFSIDNHTMDIVEVDGVEIEPISDRGVYLNIGQRYSVIVRTNQTSGNYNMRATVPKSRFQPFLPYNSSGLDSAGWHVLGVLSYDNIDPTVPTIGVAGNTTNPYGADENSNSSGAEGCNDMPFDRMKPVRAETAYTAGQNNTHYIDFQPMQAQSINRMFVNKTSWAPLASNATIWKATEISADISTTGSYNSIGTHLAQQILGNPDSNSSVEVAITSFSEQAHPWHLHGHHFQVVGWGSGPFGTGNTQWSWENPMRRDTITIPANSHVVLRWKNDNPGIWALHCANGWHLESGALVQFDERMADFRGLLDTVLDPGTKVLSQSFCGVNDDQAFGLRS